MAHLNWVMQFEIHCLDKIPCTVWFYFVGGDTFDVALKYLWYGWPRLIVKVSDLCSKWTKVSAVVVHVWFYGAICFIFLEGKTVWVVFSYQLAALTLFIQWRRGTVWCFWELFSLFTLWTAALAPPTWERLSWRNLPVEKPPLPLNSRSAHLYSIHGGDTHHTPGGETGDSRTGIRMVYTTALLHLSEEESVVEMIGKYFSQLTSPGTRSPSARWGSVESCDETENSHCKLFLKCCMKILWVIDDNKRQNMNLKRQCT